MGPYYFSLLFFKDALFDGVVDSRVAMLPRGSSSSQSSGLTAHVSQVHLNYEAMEISLEQCKTC
jgi:hypothetical protein